MKISLENMKNLTPEECLLLNSQELAFVGDSVYTLFIRHMITGNKDIKVNQLHKVANAFVCAGGQSDSIANILPILTNTEIDIYKRGRNYKTANVAKNAKVGDYKRATGFEALLGFLYLTGQNERLKQILKLAVQDILNNLNKKEN